MSNKRITKPEKDHLVEDLARPNESALAKYRRFFVGEGGSLLRYEMADWLARATPGGLGYLLRKWFYGGLLQEAGSGLQWGRNVVLRHAGKMVIGAGTAIDDDCMLCARGAAAGDFRIGRNVAVARQSILIVKSGFLDIGDEVVIGSQTFIGSVGGIRIGRAVGVAGQCYIGGGRYEMQKTDVPITHQDIYSEGEIVIGDGCSIGMGVCILDGVTIGKGCLIGAGAVVREDVPNYTIVTPHARMIMMKRDASTSAEGE